MCIHAINFDDPGEAVGILFFLEIFLAKHTLDSLAWLLCNLSEVGSCTLGSGV